MDPDDNRTADLQEGDTDDLSDGDERGEVEGFVAAAILDLIDEFDADETADSTSYSPNYILDVFSTCTVFIDGIRFERNDVTDFVWCLEGEADSTVHNENFPTGPAAPDSVREGADEPDDWNASHIRVTWLLNLSRYEG